MLAPIYEVTNHPLLIKKWAGLPTDEARIQHNILAELLLGLKAPAYAGDDGERLLLATVLQINFQLEQGLEPDISRSVSNTQPGMMTSYRDRYVSPEALRIVCDVTGVTYTAFGVPGRGV